MVNAEPSNNSNEEGPRPDSPGGARLPLQLGRLPAERLERVHQAMRHLKEEGLEELPDIDALAKSVKASHAAGNAKLPQEHLTTEYMGMSLWAWTPQRWFSSIHGMSDPAGTKSDELQHAEGDQLPPVPETTEALLNKRSLQSEHFKQWCELMKVAEAEIRSMATMDSSVLTKGDGAAVWFDPTPSIEGKGMLRRHVAHRDCWVGAPQMASRRGCVSESRPAKANSAAAILSVHLDDGLMALDAWSHIMGEHYLDTSGRPTEKEFYGCSDPLFTQSFKGRYMPRAVLAGEQSAMDSVGQAALFDPNSIVGVSTGCNVQEACVGLTVPEIMEAVRLQLERADFVEGMLITQTIGEDFLTSGLLKYVLEDLTMNLPKLVKIVSSCIADPQADHSKSSANAAISSKHQLEGCDVVLFYDATSSKKLASQKVNGFGVANPDDAECRGIASRIFSGLTGPMRFGRVDGATPSCLSHLATTLVPYPRVKYTFPSLGGLGGVTDSGMPVGFEAASAAISNGCLCTANADRTKGKTISSTMICRGMAHSMALSPVISKRLDHPQEWVDYSKGSVSVVSFQVTFAVSSLAMGTLGQPVSEIVPGRGVVETRTTMLNIPPRRCSTCCQDHSCPRTVGCLQDAPPPLFSTD